VTYALASLAVGLLAAYMGLTLADYRSVTVTPVK